METATTVPLSKADIQTLPVFQTLSIENIHVLETLEQCLSIENELYAADVLGFDTESKPTFKVGEVSTGPHLIQLATEYKAYLFQVNEETLHFLRPVLANPQQLKVGFSLRNDTQLFRKKSIELNGLLELSHRFKTFGYKSQVGVQTAIAVLFQQYFPKSKKISTSNWSTRQLSPAQVIYAASDAYAAIQVFNELKHRGLMH